MQWELWPLGCYGYTHTESSCGPLALFIMLYTCSESSYKFGIISGAVVLSKNSSAELCTAFHGYECCFEQMYLNADKDYFP
jgi:hypothetical protein